MASVMLFPNVATHRRMPHLSKEPKETTTPKSTVDASLQQQQQQQHQLTTTVLPPHSSALPATIDRTDNTNTSSSNSEDAHPSKAIASSSTSSAAGKNLLTLNTTSASLSSSSKPVANSASSSSTSLLIDGAGAGGNLSLLSTPASSIASTPLIEHHHHNNSGNYEHESSLHRHDHRRDHSDHSPPHPKLLHSNHAKSQQEQQGLPYPPLNAPHAPSCISNNTQHHPLPLSGTTSCPSASTSSSNESRLIRSALYDAFGCLYHPVQHTHSSSPCSPSGHCSQPGTSKASMCAGGSQLQATQHTLRSGEATPLISPSPRAMSPMIRPHLGLSSAPITPLELSSSSEDGISSFGSGGHGHGGAGYFGIVHGHGHGHGYGSGSGASPSSAVSSSRQLHQHLSPNHHYAHQHQHQHQQHHGIHQHPLPPVPQHHPSSLLSRTGSFNKHTHSHGHTKQHHQQDENFLHHPHNSHSQHDPTLSNGPSLLARKSSLGDIHLDPTEHPVLCSLQTLSLTHPHPANHYHPHLGHDLGHDRVSISSSPPSSNNMATVVMPLAQSGVLAKTTERP